MRPPKPLPAAVRQWAEQRIGHVVSVRDASHDWDRSRVWELEGADGVHRYVKVSPSEKFFTRETRAYRHVVPALGHSRAPHLIDSRAQDLALLLTAVPGRPAKELPWPPVTGGLCTSRPERCVPGCMRPASSTVPIGWRPKPPWKPPPTERRST